MDSLLKEINLKKKNIFFLKWWLLNLISHKLLTQSTTNKHENRVIYLPFQKDKGHYDALLFFI